MQSIVVLLFILINLTFANELNQRPVIGILTIPSDSSYFPKEKYNYILADYVKQVEGAGAQVIPIQWDDPLDKIDYLMSHVNGIFLTGGGSEFFSNQTSPGYKYNKLLETYKFVIQKVELINLGGIMFPLFATCQGFEAVIYAMSENDDKIIKSVYGNYGINRVLSFWDPSFMYKDLNLRDYLEKEIGPYFSQHIGVTVKDFVKNQALRDYFHITASHKDETSQDLVASVESKQYPIYLFQFHVEKAPYAWKTKALHTLELVQFSQEVTNQFVQLTLKVQNQVMYNNKLIIINDQLLIANYQMHDFEQDPNVHYYQLYAFENYLTRN